MKTLLVLAMAVCFPIVAHAQSYEYDVAGRLIRVAYADGKGVRYTYDVNDGLTEVRSLALPSPPSGLSVTRTANGAHEIRWEDTSGNETGFTVMRRRSAERSWTEIGTVAANTRVFLDTTAAPNESWVYQVVARNVDGPSLPTEALGPSTPAAVNMRVPGNGAVVATTASVQAPLQVGYAAVHVLSGTTPYGTAVLSFTQNGAVVSEVGVPASRPTTSARLFIDNRSGVTASSGQYSGTLEISTGVAIVNQGDDTALVTFTLRGVNGSDVLASGSGTIAKGAHVARFLPELQVVAPNFIVPQNFSTAIRFGALDIQSDQPLSILPLRLIGNQRGETLLTSTPIADLTRPPSTSPLYFPQVANGGGYITAVTLINNTSSPQMGTLETFAPDGAPLPLTPVGGSLASSFAYTIPPRGTYRWETNGSPAVVQTGWVRVTPAAGSTAPAGAGVYQLSQGGVVVTESGIPSARPTTRALIYADTSGGHDTGIALANPGSASAAITVRAFGLDGQPAAGGNPQTISLAANGQRAAFVGQVLTGLPPGFVGVVELSSTTPFAPVTLRALTNSRGEFLLTTFPTADLDQPAPGPIVFPQIADGLGYRTEFILLSPGGPLSSVIQFYSTTGAPLNIANVP